jgi:hypothetical protein
MATHFSWNKATLLIEQLQGPISAKTPEDLVAIINQILMLLGIDIDADTDNQEYHTVSIAPNTTTATATATTISCMSFLDFPKGKADIRSFETLRGNLVQFNFHIRQLLADLEQDLHPAFIKPEWRMVRAIKADFLRRCAGVLVAMWTNFLQQIESNQGRETTTLCFDHDSMDVVELDRPWGRSKTAPISSANPNYLASSPLDVLLQGRLEQALTLVPSRELARKLGMSDQKLRREIYLARQRAMAEGKTNGLVFSQEAPEPVLTFHHDPPIAAPVPIPIPSPIPPPSHPELTKAKALETLRLRDLEPEVQTVEDDWMDVSTWLCSEIFEN